MYTIPLFKPSLTSNDYRAIQNSLKTGWLTHGPQNLIFEKNFTKLINVKYAVSMNSCTSALECALKVIKKRYSKKNVSESKNTNKILQKSSFLRKKSPCGDADRSHKLVFRQNHLFLSKSRFF